MLSDLMKFLLPIFFAAASLAVAQPTVYLNTKGSNMPTGDRDTFLTNVGGSTAGKNLFRMANPSANSYARVASNGVVTWRDATGVKADLAITASDVAGLSVLLDPKLTAPAGLLKAVENPDNKVLVLDKFEDRAKTFMTPAGTRNANPGPGVMTALTVPAQSQVVAGQGALYLTRNPVTTATYTNVRYAGIPAANGLTMIIRGVPAYAGRYVPDVFGWSLSATDIVASPAGAFLESNGGDNAQEGVNLLMFPRDVSQPAFNGHGLADRGELVSKAITLVSPTERAYWIQGGRFAESMGCYNYSDNWYYLGSETAATSIPLGTTVYPFLQKQNGHGAALIKEVRVLSKFTPSKRFGQLDFKGNGSGIHCPTIIKDPTTGLVVSAWNNGTTHEDVDTKINARVRLADGTWSALQTLVPASGSPAVMNIGTLSNVAGSLWLTYWINPTGPDGGVLYRRVLTVNPTTGVISVGPQVAIPNMAGVRNLAFGHILTLANGRVLLPYHTAAKIPYLVYSDNNGSTWTNVQVSESQGYETTMVLETGGAIGAFHRNDDGFVYYQRSTDNGLTWSAQTVINGISGAGRTMVKNIGNEIVLMTANSRTQRRRLTMFRMGDNGVVLGEQLMGDVALENARATVYTQYPDFILDGDDLLFVFSRQGELTATSIDYGTRRWAGGAAIAWEQVGYNPPKDTLYRTLDGVTELQATGHNTVVLSSGATLTTECRLSNYFTVTLATNTTLSAPTGPLSWQPVTWVIVQDGTGGRTLTLNAIFDTGPYDVVLSTAAGSSDVLTAIWNPQTAKMQVVNFIRGDGVSALKRIRATGIPNYANDAAADADAALPVGSFYTVTGNRGLFKKP